MGHISTQPETRQERANNVRPIPGALQWIKEHWDEYEGQWVAVGPTGLAAAAETLADLEVKLGGSLKGVLIDHLV